MSQSLARRLPFFYGWVVVAVAFVTMGIGVNSRTAFSLLYPPILTEFRWDHGVTAGAFSFGFIAGTVLTPFIGAMMDRFGPRWVVPTGAVTVAAELEPDGARPDHQRPSRRGLEQEHVVAVEQPDQPGLPERWPPEGPKDPADSTATVP